MKIDICIATYRRPDWLQLLLVDIAQLEVPASAALHVIVVDNDPACSAEAVVAAAAARTPHHTLLYLRQPQKNIALTRNMALDHSRADWVAFVDDDERVPPHWLQTLLECQHRFEADVVFGPVEGCLEANAPAWVQQSRFFAALSQATGTPQLVGATNNALVRARFIEAGARFESRFGLSGGEDTHFFYGLSKRGARMVWCQEAAVTEHVPAARTTFRWLLLRHFRGGQTFADVVNRPAQPLNRLLWVLRRAAMLLVSSASALLTAPFNRGLAARLAGKAAAYAGELSTLFRYRLQVYR